MAARRSAPDHTEQDRSVGSRSATRDRYSSNRALYADRALVEGVDYGRRFSIGNARTTILAPHGGEIEQGTSELCLAIAGYHPETLRPDPPLYDYWIFEGLRSNGNADLHVSSLHCDDVVANASCHTCPHALSLHGCRSASARVPKRAPAVLVGGRDAVFRGHLRTELLAAGFHAVDASDHGFLSGLSPNNIVNRTALRMGAQLELTTALRRSMFDVDTLRGRPSTTTHSFWAFVRAARRAVLRNEGTEQR